MEQIQGSYNVTYGYITVKGRPTSEDHGSEQAAEQIARWAAQGARDRENNAFYDVQKRIEQTAALMAVVGYTYGEHLAQSTFRETDWSSEAMQSHLSRIGYGTSAQTQARQMMDSAQFIYLDGENAGKDYLPNHQVYQPSQDQLRQLQATGSCIANGGRIGICGQSEQQTARILQAASAEQDKSASTFDVAGRRDMRQSLSDIASHQVSYIASFSAQYGVSGFNGSKKQVTELDRALDKNLKKLNAQRSRIIDPEQIAQLDRQIARLKEQKGDLSIFSKTGANADKKHAGADMRAYGRRMIAQQFLGDDFSRGLRTYQMGGKIVGQSLRLGARGLSAAGTGAVGLVGKAVGNVAKGTKVGAVGNRVAEGSKKLDRAVKDKTRRHSRGEKRERRRDRRDNARANRDKRLLKQSEKNKNELTGLRTKKEKSGLTVKESKRLEKLKKRQSRHTKRGEQRIRVNEKRVLRRRKWADRKKAIQNSGVYKLLAAPLRAVNAVNYALSWLKKKGILIIAIALLVIVIFEAMLGAVISVPPIMTSFFGSAMDDVMNANYTQRIVNETANDLSRSFMDAAISDAEKHFLIDDPVSSDGLEWYRAVSEGKIVNVIAQEDTEAFLRSQGRDVEQLPGVNANLLQITSMMHYHLADEIDFDNYSTGKAYMYYLYARSHDIVRFSDGTPTYGYENQEDHADNELYENLPYFDSATGSVVRGAESCTNVYVHGYNTISFADGTAYSAKVNELRATVSSFLTKTLQGLLADYLQEEGVRSGLVSDDMLKASGLWVNEIPSDAAGTCDNYTVMRGALNCSCATHIHSEECFWTTDPHSGARIRCDTPQCEEAAHTHSPWVSPENPGCYDTYYLCMGHCGGHICPTVDVSVAMDWETLIQMDAIKITNPVVSDVDFWNINTAGTISDWRDDWIHKTNTYFDYYPNSPASAYLWLGKNIFSTVAGRTGGTEGEALEASDDSFDFDGWFLADGTIDPDKLDDMNTLYGTRDTDFEAGVECWKDFEVTFPAACGQPLTEAEIASVLEQVRTQNPGITSRKLAVIEEALRGVGQYWYSCDGNGHINGLYNTSGPSECSGFVGGVLNRALGTSYSCAAADYASYGTSRAKKAGDVIAHNRGGEGYTGHVMIYLGYLPEGVPGYRTYSATNIWGTEQAGGGFYVIDCNPSNGGSVLRQMDFGDLSGYNAWCGY